MNLAPEAQGQILGFYVFEEEGQVEYWSLKSMLATLKACYEQGIFSGMNKATWIWIIRSMLR